MLESMTIHALPTRAETSDIANAVLDGTDSLMLSAETAVGNYPVESVKMMNRIIIETEHQETQFVTHNHTYNPTDTYTLREVISYAAMVSANNLQKDKIVLFTVSGKTARLLSKLRPSADIFAFTPSRKTMLQLNLEWGVTPFFMGYRKSPEEMIRDATTQLKRKKLIKRSNFLIFIIDSSDKKHENYSLILKKPL
jgi:pyruvate kinase